MAGPHPKAGTVLPSEGGPGSPLRRGPAVRQAGIVNGPQPGSARLSVRQPYGYALRSAGPPHDEERYNVVVLDAAGAVLLALGPFCEIDVVATWRALGAHSGLPLLIEHGGGDLRPVCDQIGRLRLGRTHARRRHTILNRRRPRFLVRRKPGRMVERTQASRGGG